jgi:hypothetical protein
LFYAVVAWIVMHVAIMIVSDNHPDYYDPVVIIGGCMSHFFFAVPLALIVKRQLARRPYSPSALRGIRADCKEPRCREGCDPQQSLQQEEKEAEHRHAPAPRALAGIRRHGRRRWGHERFSGSHQATCADENCWPNASQQVLQT